MERTIRVDAADYLSRALAEIDDLTGDTREDLKDSIESAVIEVAAEFPDDLELLLGPPERFVAELRVAAGVDPALPRRMPSQQVLATSRAWVDERVSALKRHHWVQWIATLGRELRPAWWVIRPYGWLVAVGLLTTGYFTLDWIGPMPFPRILSSVALGPVTLLAAIVGSVELGRRSQIGWRRLAVAVGNVLAVFMLIGTAAEVGERIGYAAYDDPVAEVAYATYPLIDNEGLATARMFGVPIAVIEMVDLNGDIRSFTEPDVHSIDEIRTNPPAGEITVHTIDGRSVAFESVELFIAAVDDEP